MPLKFKFFFLNFRPVIPKYVPRDFLKCSAKFSTFFDPNIYQFRAKRFHFVKDLRHFSIFAYRGSKFLSVPPKI